MRFSTLETPGRGPSRTCGFLFFGPGPHLAAKCHLAAVHFDRDTVGIEFGI